MTYPHLFQPIDIGPRTAKNRVMQLATTNNLDDQGLVGDDLVAFYEERAKGGVGMIVTEGLAAHPSTHGDRGTSLGRGRVGAFRAEAAAGLRRLADAVHQHDVLLIGQTYHGGRQHHSSQVPTVWGPSAIPCPHSGGVPHAMSHQEIASTVDGFATAAAQLAAAGFDGVEIHGAQGHLIQEFFSPFSNDRTDDYGGSLPNRMRFATEIIEEVRRRVGDQFLVGFRLGADERSPGGLTIHDTCEIAGVLATHGVIDYLSVSQGNFNSIEIHTPDRHFPRVAFSDHVKKIRQTVAGALPVIGCGRVITPAEADDEVSSGAMDLVGLCRPLLADAFWAHKAQHADRGPIRQCISCNQCWGDIITEKRISCIHNAATGRERQWGDGSLVNAAEPRRVLVIGAGPAGLETARVAALRGHDVTVLDRRDALGGSVVLAARIPGHEEIGHVVDYLEPATRQAGVRIELATEATPDVVRQHAPDTVVVASGADYPGDRLGSTGDLQVYGSRELIDQEIDLGDRVVIFDEDGYYQAPEVAEYLAKRGTRVTIVTRFWHVGREIPAVSRVTTHRALDELGIDLVAVSWLHRVDGREVLLEHHYSGRTWSIGDASALVHVGHDRPRDSLATALVDDGFDIHTIGDAYMARRIKDAIREGHELGRAL